MQNIFVYNKGRERIMENNADIIIIGTVYTAENGKRCEAFAVKDGKFIYVGDKQGVNAYIKEGETKVLDYGCSLIIPGCTEGHGHFIGIDGLVRIMPGYYVDYPEILDLLKEKVKEGKLEQFLSWGFDYLKIQNNPEP